MIFHKNQINYYYVDLEEKKKQKNNPAEMLFTML
jgi:hypothetical protein